MPQIAYNPADVHCEILECKNCGFRMKVLKGQRKVFNVRCRNCHGTRFRRVF